MISFAATATLHPTTSAHTPAWQIPTYAYVVAEPNPIGVSQSALVVMFLDKMPDGAGTTNDIRFHDYKLTITAPDGSVETKTWDIVYDPTSSQGYSFTPKQVGTYTLNFTFPGQTHTWTETIQPPFAPPRLSQFVNDTYLPSTATTTLTVQQEPLTNYPDSYPLPTEYWDRPIYGENSGWHSISSNWLGSGAPGGYFPGDAVGSQTSHIMWTKSLQSGGIVGGNNFAIQGDSYFEGSAYNIRFANPIILNGKLYYQEPMSFSNGVGVAPTNCIDLRTGQLLWSRTDVPTLAFGYLYAAHNMGQHGVLPAMLFTSNFARAFDADTGTPLFNVTNVPSGTTALGTNGEQLKYVLANAGTPTNPQYYLAQWNSSRMWVFEKEWAPSPQMLNMSGAYFQLGGGLRTFTALSSVIGIAGQPGLNLMVDAGISIGINSRYDWNISLSALNAQTSTPAVLAAFPGNMLLCRNGSYPTAPGGSVGSLTGTSSSAPYTYFAVNLNATKGAVGSILWWNTVNAPAGNLTVELGGVDPSIGVFVETRKETMQYVGYSLSTGQQLWGPVGNHTAFAYYGLGTTAAYGKLYSCGFEGLLYCYDMTNGDLLWTYGNGGEGNSTNSGFQVPGFYPMAIFGIGNGVVYTTTSEHTSVTPIFKGALTRAINATTGQEIYTLSAITNGIAAYGAAVVGGASAAIADGFTTFFNGYSNQIFVLGRGPSKTTVDAPKASIELGRSLVITGSVTDISSGTTKNEQSARFPNGVPVSSDNGMKDWMGYVYQQKPLPTNATGVIVTLSVVDANNNYRTIGTTTTDMTGVFSYQWKPDISGKYTVYASFAGTNGYWPSSAETSFAVDEIATQQPTTTPETDLATTSDLMMYMAIGVIAIIIAIAIATVLLLRKRP
jgi:hypothetical protein